jgi:hypothetical protein
MVFNYPTLPEAYKVAALEFLQRLASLVPRPRLHLIRFHGVLAPNAKLPGNRSRYGRARRRT